MSGKTDEITKIQNFTLKTEWIQLKTIPHTVGTFLNAIEKS